MPGDARLGLAMRGMARRGNPRVLTMRYWCFHERQLESAIDAFVERLKRDKTLVHKNRAHPRAERRAAAQRARGSRRAEGARVKYWVFTDEQLERALAAYVRRGSRASSGECYPAAVESMEAEARAVRDFLNSPEARVFKLQGGASYEPDRQS